MKIYFENYDLQLFSDSNMVLVFIEEKSSFRTIQFFHMFTLKKGETIRDRFRTHSRDSIRMLLNSRAEDYPGKQPNTFGIPFSYSGTRGSLFQYENWHRPPFFKAYFHERQMLRRY